MLTALLFVLAVGVLGFALVLVRGALTGGTGALAIACAEGLAD